jgi:hypothetical protein
MDGTMRMRIVVTLLAVAMLLLAGDVRLRPIDECHGPVIHELHPGDQRLGGCWDCEGTSFCI